MARSTESDTRRAAYMKLRGIVRKTQRCPNCYGIVTCESAVSKYTHTCHGRRGA